MVLITYKSTPCTANDSFVHVQITYTATPQVNDEIPNRGVIRVSLSENLLPEHSLKTVVPTRPVRRTPFL